MTERAYVQRIIECVDLMVKDGVISSVEELQIKYGLPAISIESLSNESEEAINKVIDTLSERNPAFKVYIQTGAKSKIIDNNPVQVGRGNLYGNNNKTKESTVEEDCCVKLDRAMIEIKYLKKAIEERDSELAKKDLLIAELIGKLK